MTRRTLPKHILGHGGRTIEPVETVSTTPRQPGRGAICSKNGRSGYTLPTPDSLPYFSRRVLACSRDLYQLTSLSNCSIHSIKFYHFIRSYPLGAQFSRSRSTPPQSHRKVKIYLPLQFSSPRFPYHSSLCFEPYYRVLLSYMASCL